MRKSLLVMLAVLLPSMAMAAEPLRLRILTQTLQSGKRLAVKRLSPTNACAQYGTGFVMIEGTSTCMKIGGAVGIGAGVSQRLALTYVIGGAMNLVKPGRVANCANQRSRFGRFGLVTPSTPSQRRA